ncbi:DUF4387 domain-containing protein [Siminovitchia sp. FSL H7-0308]|uniref:DUF4387 domain-containing protein n=1 Tax=Siminovitchia thermophila TaxID=1245522 RepID=A0ABS2R817_9BACI|nr:DUF4387 domain-containing protein [Siminovitchia thermophila]MBM7715769.1 hypothetical protein [Siminovitchia thermophila]ONK23571.1 acyl-CoA synthetase [Bacillus sp. VT-16-64]
MKTKPLQELAKTIRSKNAGTDKITFDIIFDDPALYKQVCNSNVITKKNIAELYAIPEHIITDFVQYDPANAIKFTILRKQPSGSPGDGDIFGSQQYPPLLDLQIPVEQ